MLHRARSLRLEDKSLKDFGMYLVGSNRNERVCFSTLSEQEVRESEWRRGCAMSELEAKTCSNDPLNAHHSSSYSNQVFFQIN